jgi:uncharacterized protein (DUF2235 family)
VARNLVVCLDGTSNEPESGTTNVARTYAVAAKSDTQLVYYDPGVGTMGARGAVTRLGKGSTRVAGLVVGYGVKDNIEEAYNWLSGHYERGDQIFVLGFSRGAYTARALTGMLRTVGLLRPGTDNLTPYALKLYAKSGGDDPTADEEKEFWKVRRAFTDRFGNPDLPHAFDPHRKQIRFLGVWDTVKTIGWLNWKARFEQARWPFTRRITNVDIARHAMSLDERRRPYPVYRFDPAAVAEAGGRYVEQWFAGVHSDVGGQYVDDHRLSDIAFGWMVDEAVSAGLEVDPKAFKRLAGFPLGESAPPERVQGKVHDNGGPWVLLGGWKPREVLPGDLVHPSVQQKVAAGGYRPRATGFPR